MNSTVAAPAEDAKKKRKAVPGGRVRLLNIPRGWAHQAFFYQDRTQRAGWIAFELVGTVLLALSFGGITQAPLSNAWLWFGAVLVTHTINWVLNGNWWAGMLFTFPSLRNPGERATCDYLNSMARRLTNCRAVSGVMIFGSVSRGQWHDRSDLDMRLLRREGLLNGLIGIAALFREKLIALLARQPLDMYLADDASFLMKMRRDEPPVFLKKDDPRLDELYPNGLEVRIERLAPISLCGPPNGN